MPTQSVYTLHLKANARRRKNFIAALCDGSGSIATKQPRKDEELPPTSFDNSSLDEPFTADKILVAVKKMPGDRALGLDGLARGFYKAVAPLNLPEFVLDFMQLYELNRASVHRLNTTNIILLAKRGDSAGMADYRPLLSCTTLPR
ncbi:hypothetical protein D1007_07753 [Hordeum vulgare]|nr:hypothetical protein D1007_07753 [Hordeum vulgare]